MRIKVIFRENFRERRAPCTLLLHPQNEGTFPFVWISSAVLRDGDPRRKLSFESLPRLCLSGAGTLNHSSICLGAKFFPKTPALSLICKLPRPGEGENVFCCIASRCRGRQPPDRSCSLCLAPQGSRPLWVPGAAGSCCVRPWRQQDVIHLLPSLLSVPQSRSWLPSAAGAASGSVSRLCCSVREPFRHRAPAQGASSFRRVTLCVLPDLICVTCGCCQPSDWLLKPADVIAPGLPGRWAGFALSLDD